MTVVGEVTEGTNDLESMASSNGWFQLAVPADGSCITIKKIVRHQGDGAPVNMGDILKKLKSHKVTCGVDAAAIEELLKSLDANEIPEQASVIARSDVEEGEDGKLDWKIEGLLEETSDVIVVADMSVASMKKARIGKAGRNVFGKKKQARPVFDPQLSPGSGIRTEENQQGEISYITNHAGQLKFQDDTVFVDSHVRISDDQMQVHMHIPAGYIDDVNRSITEEDILAVVAAEDISYGIVLENIRSALSAHGEKRGLSKNVLIGSGLAPIHGENARLLIEDSLAVGKLLENGQIDFHEKSYSWNIKTGEVLGKVLAGQVEKDGFNVFGKIIPANTVEKINLNLEGVEEEADGTLRAHRDGILLVKGQDISIVDSLTVEGNVCHRTGNIRADGTVIVKGYVESGFKIESKGDVIVQENIEQAEVRARGSIVVKSGVRGSQSKLVARGNISAAFMENANVKALGDIKVENSLVSCDIFCWEKLYIGSAKTKKSTLVGGQTWACKGVIAANLGSEGFKKTMLRVGAHPEVLQKIKKLDEELNNIEQEYKELEHKFLQLRQSSADASLIQKLGITVKFKKQGVSQLQIEQQGLRAQIQASRKATVVIYQHVYPGVRVRILDKTYDVKKIEKAGTFFLEDELILFRPAVQNS